MSKPPAFEAHLEQAPLGKEDVTFRLHPRARNYVARIDGSGNIVITVPRGGSRRGALSFANAHREWLKLQQAKARAERDAAARKGGLKPGDSIWYRGRKTRLSLGKDWGRPVLRFAGERIYLADEGMDLARPLKERLKALAKEELPPLVFEFASRFGLKVAKVAVRDQKTRWGSCSNSRTISLNWRLLLAPHATRDYVIIHELMHLKRFDHSASFWRLVEKACPGYEAHERWLNEHQDELNW